MALLATVAIDARPTVFGNKAVVTGTITNADATSGHIDLSGLLASVDMIVVNGVGSTALAAASTAVDGTTVYLANLTSGASGDYQFMAMGNRS